METMPRLPLVAFGATLALGMLVMASAAAVFFRREPAGGDLGRLRAALGAFGAVTIVSAAILAGMIAFPEPPKTIRQLYVHAIQADDRDAAWGLLCRADRQRVTRSTFDQAVTVALAELGGKITDAHPTRAAYEWTGVNGKRVYRAPETSGVERPCIVLGSNPLGDG